jgi:hypothetical protein
MYKPKATGFAPTVIGSPTTLLLAVSITETELKLAT